MRRLFMFTFDERTRMANEIEITYSSFIDYEGEKKSFYRIDYDIDTLTRWLDLPTYADIDKIMDKIGAVDARHFGYAFENEQKVITAIQKLRNIIAKKSAFKCFHGHTIDPDEYEAESFAKCCECNRILGYYCAENKPSLCEYEETDYANDNCIHCGNPEERK